jgi:hypothetical protein
MSLNWFNDDATRLSLAIRREETSFSSKYLEISMP